MKNKEQHKPKTTTLKALSRLFLIGMFFLSGFTASSQVSVNVNIGSPPLWGPIGYTEVQYYYIPDVEAYYDINTSMFIYFSDGIWIHRTYLPSRYASYDLYGGYKVVLTDYHGSTPYMDFNTHKGKYGKGYKGGNQQTIGARPGKSPQAKAAKSERKMSVKREQSGQKNSGGAATGSKPGNAGKTSNGKGNKRK
jgi:hypothetical protein